MSFKGKTRFFKITFYLSICICILPSEAISDLSLSDSGGHKPSYYRQSRQSDNYSFLLDCSIAGMVDFQMLYGVLDLNTPGFGSGLGGTIRLIPFKFLGVGFEYQRRLTTRELAYDGGMLLLYTPEELEGEPTVNVKYTCDAFTFLLQPGYVIRNKTRSFGVLFPHAEIAVGWQKIELNAEKDTSSISLNVNHPWNFGLGAVVLHLQRAHWDLHLE